MSCFLNLLPIKLFRFFIVLLFVTIVSLFATFDYCYFPVKENFSLNLTAVLVLKIGSLYIYFLIEIYYLFIICDARNVYLIIYYFCKLS